MFHLISNNNNVPVYLLLRLIASWDVIVIARDIIFCVDENPTKEKLLICIWYIISVSICASESSVKMHILYIHMYICTYIVYICAHNGPHSPEFVRPECQTRCGEYLGKEKRKGKPGIHHLEMIRGCVRSCIHMLSSSHYDAINKCRVHYGFREDSVKG